MRSLIWGENNWNLCCKSGKILRNFQAGRGGASFLRVSRQNTRGRRLKRNARAVHVAFHGRAISINRATRSRIAARTKLHQFKRLVENRARILSRPDT